MPTNHLQWPFQRHFKLIPPVSIQTAPPSWFPTSAKAMFSKLEPRSLSIILDFHTEMPSATKSCWFYLLNKLLNSLICLPSPLLCAILIYYSLPELCNHFWLSLRGLVSAPFQIMLYTTALAIVRNSIMSFHCLKTFNASPLHWSKGLSMVTRLILAWLCSLLHLLLLTFSHVCYSVKTLSFI